MTRDAPFIAARLRRRRSFAYGVSAGALAAMAAVAAYPIVRPAYEAVVIESPGFADLPGTRIDGIRPRGSRTFEAGPVRITIHGAVRTVARAPVVAFDGRRETFVLRPPAFASSCTAAIRIGPGGARAEPCRGPHDGNPETRGTEPAR